jgi:hypothetical protein
MHVPVSDEKGEQRLALIQAQAQGQQRQHSTNFWILGTGPSGSSTRGDPWQCEDAEKAQRVRDAMRCGLDAKLSRLTRATGAGVLVCRNLASPARN